MTNPLFEYWYEKIFADIVARPDVEEIAINTVPVSDETPTIVWVRFRGGQAAIPYIFPRDRAVNLLLFTAMAANVGNQYFGPKAPMVYAPMPDGARFVAAHGAVTPFQLNDGSGLAICLRGHEQRAALAAQPFPLEPATHQVVLPENIPHVPVQRLLELGTRLREEGKGVIFIGDKGVGKTNAVKNVLRQLDPLWRCVVIEDQREIPPILPNTLFLTVPRTSFDINRRVEQILEMSARTPAQVLVLGEISGPLAARMERISQQGFHAVFTTLHGMNNERGLVRLYQEIAFGTGLTGAAAMDPGTFRDFVVSRFGALVHLEEDRATGAKLISSIEAPKDVLERIRLPNEPRRAG